MTARVAHRLSTLRDADQVYVIEHGRVGDAGTHPQKSSRTGQYRDMNDLLAAQ